MEMHAEEAGNWKGFASEEDEESDSEDLSAGVDLTAKLPAVFEGIRNHLKVPDISFDEFFADGDRLLNRLGEWASSIQRRYRS